MLVNIGQTIAAQGANQDSKSPGKFLWICLTMASKKRHKNFLRKKLLFFFSLEKLKWPLHTKYSLEKHLFNNVATKNHPSKEWMSFFSKVTQ
jgi:hypothetical protein